MTAPDPFAHDDAAYVLGALDGQAREAYERHLDGCAGCRDAVAALRRVTVRMGGVTEVDLVQDPVPSTLLPSLLRAAARRRRRARALTAGLAGLAAAAVLAFVVAVWPGRSTSPSPGAEGQPTASAQSPRPTQSPAPSSSASKGSQRFVTLVSEPISARATLVPRAWGTEIDLQCVYSGTGSADNPVPYRMYAFDRTGVRYSAGGWLQKREVRYVGGTSLAPGQISRVDILAPDGTTLLRLTTA